MRWSDEFMHKLLGLSGNQGRIELKYLSNYQEDLYRDFVQSANRLLLLDYDETLVPFADEPKEAAPCRELKNILHQLVAMPGLTVVVISGRERMTLDLDEVVCVYFATSGSFLSSVLIWLSGNKLSSPRFLTTKAVVAPKIIWSM